ncbi:hypothetical protein AMK17_25545 [Streptomyces sp. CB00072]|nr:hypothetical protein AMK17_25545 [Streptomyces sp. CB00072]
MTDSFEDCGEAHFASAHLTQVDGEVVEGACEVGQVGVGVGFGQGAADFDSLLNCGQAFFASAHLSQADGEAVEGGGEVGQVGVGVRSG